MPGVTLGLRVGELRFRGPSPIEEESQSRGIVRLRRDILCSPNVIYEIALVTYRAMAWSRRLFAVFVVLSLVAFVWFSEVPLFSGTLFDPGRQADKTIELAGTESNVAVLSVVASPSSPPFSPLLPAAAPPSSQPTTPTTEATRKDLPQLTFWLSDLHDGTRADLTSMLTKGLGQRVIMAGSRKKHSELPGATVDPTHKFATYYPEVYRHPLVSFPTRPLPRALSSMKSGEPPVEPDMLELYEYYKDDPDMARVDAFVCTFPMAFCEAYMPFQRPIIWMPAHRYPMGRCSKADRTRLDAHLGAALQRGDKFAAMSMYDAGESLRNVHCLAEPSARLGLRVFVLLHGHQANRFNIVIFMVCWPWRDSLRPHAT